MFFKEKEHCLKICTIFLSFFVFYFYIFINNLYTIEVHWSENFLFSTVPNRYRTEHKKKKQKILFSQQVSAFLFVFLLDFHLKLLTIVINKAINFFEMFLLKVKVHSFDLFPSRFIHFDRLDFANWTKRRETLCGLSMALCNENKKRKEFFKKTDTNTIIWMSVFYMGSIIYVALA